MLELSNSDYEKLEKEAGRRENKETKILPELEQDEYQFIMEERDVKEQDNILIGKIKKYFKIDDVNTIRFMPQFIFAKNLRITVKDRKINQTKFEKEHNLPHKSISKYINGFLFPDMDTMIKISKGLDMSIYQMLGMTKFSSLPIDEINQITGLSEKSMRVLYMLHHNIPEGGELTNNIPISNRNKMKIDIFNSLIEDNVNFLNFLNRFEQYAKLKSKLQKVEKEDDDYIKKEKNQSNREIKNKLLRNKRRVI